MKFMSEYPLSGSDELTAIVLIIFFAFFTLGGIVDEFVLMFSR